MYDNTKKKIVITTDGKTTTAKLYDDKDVVKTATAKRSPEDKFDFITGAKLAMERLAKGYKPTYYNGKVVCVGNNIANHKFYTVGKIYEFVDGKFICDDGDELPIIGQIKSFDDFCEYTSSKFIEIVE